MKNKDEKCKYLFVDSGEIKRLSFEIKREASLNDFDNVFYVTGTENLNAIFEENGIPLEFRKIVIKLKLPLSLGVEAEDYITKTGYNLAGPRKMATKNGTRYISGVSREKEIDKYFSFNKFTDFKKYEDVINFYSKLKENGLLEKYIVSILSFYRKLSSSFNIDEMLKYTKIKHMG